MQEINILLQRLSMTMQRMIVFCGCALLVLTLAGMSYGQAGRRVQKPKSDPPVPKPTETVAPVGEPTPEPEKIPLLVGGGRMVSMRYALGLADNLPGVVGRRLQDSKRVRVASGGDMSRGEANKRAKDNENNSFVVWVELLSSGFDIDSPNTRTRFEDFYISYVVLEPGTGKMKDQGTVGLRSVRGGIFGGTLLRLPSCFPQPRSNLEYAITVAGIETAERILSRFSLIVPQPCS